MTIRLVVADDDLLVREGVLALLATQPDLDVVAHADDYDSLLDAVAREQPDVVLTDVRMPPTSSDEGIRAARLIAERHPGIGVVVLSQYLEPRYAIDLLERGSEGRGYLLKERVSDVDQLAGAVRDVAAGRSCVDPKVVDRLVAARRADESSLRWLTPRETEVLSVIAQGKDNPAVAEALGISIRSVEKHINAIFAKLGLSEATGVSSRVAAVLVYLERDGTAGSAPRR